MNGYAWETAGTASANYLTPRPRCPGYSPPLNLDPGQRPACRHCGQERGPHFPSRTEQPREGAQA